MKSTAVGLLTALVVCNAASAEISDGKLRIGVLTDLSGGYEQNSGAGSVEAAKRPRKDSG